MAAYKQTIFIVGLHGNEEVPLIALAAAHVPFLVGNPKALTKGVRFIDTDLNASFGKSGKGYECERAKEILKKIPKDTFVVDLHTTTAKTEPFVIVVTEAMIPFAARTGLKKVVIMKHNIKKGHALINYRQGISIEVGNHRDVNSFETTLFVTRNLRMKKRMSSVEVYEVYDRIETAGIYENFKEHEDGFIPVLAGEKAYPFYGLKARKIK